MHDVLVVEDQPNVANAIVRAVARHAPAARAASVRDALRMAREPERTWMAAIVDVGLPDGCGIDLARRLRELLGVQVLVVTGRDQRTLANDAQAIGAHFAFKPVGTRDIDTFMQRVIRDQPDRRVIHALDALVEQWELSARETELVRLRLA